MIMKYALLLIVIGVLGGCATYVEPYGYSPPAARVIITPPVYYNPPVYYPRPYYRYHYRQYRHY